MRWLLVLVGIGLALGCAGPAAPAPTPTVVTATPAATRTIEPWQRTATAEKQQPTATPRPTNTPQAPIIATPPTALPTVSPAMRAYRELVTPQLAKEIDLYNHARTLRSLRATNPALINDSIWMGSMRFGFEMWRDSGTTLQTGRNAPAEARDFEARLVAIGQRIVALSNEGIRAVERRDEAAFLDVSRRVDELQEEAQSAAAELRRP
jgi:hypothetical protein